MQEVEYPDGSRFKGTIEEGEGFDYLQISHGEYRKKSKNNNSYYKRYTGGYKEGVPHGSDGAIEIKLSAWPRYHALKMSTWRKPR
jgi:hypothetical protein